jgi:hypothetical protein
MSPEEAVTDYTLNHRTLARAEIRAFEKEFTLRDAIRRAAVCLWPNGKRLEHQYRIPQALLEEAEHRLQAITPKTKQAADFSTLHDLVDHEIGSIRGIGPLTVYDISHRVGAYLKKAPKLVYLHRGTKPELRCLALAARELILQNCHRLFHV